MNKISFFYYGKSLPLSLDTMAHAGVLVLLLIVGPGVTASTHTVIDGTAAPSIRFDGIGGLSGVSCHSACVCLSLCVQATRAARSRQRHLATEHLLPLCQLHVTC